MDCKKANEYMMKYMDSCLGAAEEETLNLHLNTCLLCKEDFLVYTKILNEFSILDNIIEAPADFEIAVMAKIHELDNIAVKKSDCYSTAIGLIYALSGAGMLFWLNRAEIITYINSSISIKYFVKQMTSFESHLTNFKTGIESTLSLFTNVLVELKSISLSLMVVLLLVQIVIYNRENKKIKI